jgi:predicted ATPase
MIESIAIDNYRCLGNFQLRPGDINLVLGANGTGKSAVMDALAAIRAIAVGAALVADSLPSHTLTRWDRRRLQRFELDVRGNGGLYHYLLLVHHDEEHGSAAIRQERLEKDSRVLFRFDGGYVHLHRNNGAEGASFPFSASQSFISLIEPREENTDLVWFRDNFLRRVWLGRLDPTRMADLAEVEHSTLARDGSNFAGWYRHLVQESPETVAALTKSLGQVIPHARHLRLSNQSVLGRRLLVSFKPHEAEEHQRDAYELGLSELSDGQRALIALYALLHATIPIGITLFVDEPDNFVSLAEIQPWLVELCDALRGKGQVIVVSHHPEVIDYLVPEASTFVFERPGGGPSRAEPMKFDATKGLRVSQLMARGLLP